MGNKNLDLSNEKLDIIILAGQSNAQGNGRGNEELHYKGNPKAFQLTTRHPVNYIEIKGFDGTSIYPFLHQIEGDLIFNELNEDYHDDRYNHGFYLSFADNYINEILDNDRKVIVVKTASGGTGFTDKMWTKDGEMYNRLFEMVDLTLSLNKENRVVALLWHQGECDLFSKMPIDVYKKNLISLFNDVRNKYGTFPMLVGDFSKDWSDNKENKKQASVYSNMFKNLPNDYSLCGFVSSDGLASNGRVNNNDDFIHFSRVGQIEFGERYFKVYKTLQK